MIVLATQSVKNDFLYQEAFIATYRTFVSTHDLLEKLVQRFRKFNNRKDEQQMIYKRVAHCAFSLMVSSINILFSVLLTSAHKCEMTIYFPVRVCHTRNFQDLSKYPC